MIKQFIESDFCLKCYGCCRFRQKYSVWTPHLLDKEAKNISKKNNCRFFISQKKTIIPQRFSNQKLFACPFLNLKSNKCKIYKIRPFDCRLYPFLINKKGKNIFLAVHMRCPCVGENIKSENFTKYAEYLTNLLNAPRFKTILKNNPQVINKYNQTINLAQLKF